MRRQVTVWGDAIIDHNIAGSANRLAPDAPAPVVRVAEENYSPGGAANAAANAASAGYPTAFFFLQPPGEYGTKLRGGLQQLRIKLFDVELPNNCPAIVKHRVFAQKRLMLRYDLEELNQPARIASARALASMLLGRLTNDDFHPGVLLISDYGKQTCDPEAIQEVIATAKQRNVPVVVDPCPRHCMAYKGATALTPNLSQFWELAARSGCAEQISNDEQYVAETAIRMLVAFELQALYVTRGEDGMLVSYYDPSSGDPVATVVPAQIPIMVCDPSGAGDTAAAMIAIGTVEKLPPPEVAQLANAVAGQVVQIVGTGALDNNSICELWRRSPFSLEDKDPT